MYKYDNNVTGFASDECFCNLDELLSGQVKWYKLWNKYAFEVEHIISRREF